MDCYHRMRRWFSKPPAKVFLALVVLSIASFFPAFLSNSHDLQIYQKYGGVIINDLPANDDGIAIAGRVSHFDWSTVETISVSWSIIGCGKYRLQNGTGYSSETMPPDRALNVYINNLSNPVFSYDPNDIPVTRDSAKTILNPLITFSTKHDIDFGNPEYNAPNDWYSFFAFAFVVEKDTNNSIPTIYFNLDNSGAGDFSTGSLSHGTPSSNQFTYDGEGGSTTVEVDSYTIYPVIERSRRAKALTFSLFAINWMMTLCSIITTSIVFSREGEVKDGVALLPITVILTIPTIRSLYPGSPPFGIYLDVVGFFPQMLIVVACTVLVLLLCSKRTIGGKGGYYPCASGDLSLAEKPTS